MKKYNWSIIEVLFGDKGFIAGEQGNKCQKLRETGEQRT